MSIKFTKKCPYCSGKGEVRIAHFLPVSKMVKIAKKYKLTQLKIAELIGITQSGVNNWFNPKTCIQGIRTEYFEILKKKGYS